VFMSSVVQVDWRPPAGSRTTSTRGP
jgi:hypothetical protein